MGGGGGAGGKELEPGLTAEVGEYGLGDHRIADGVEGEIGKREGSVAETGELLAEKLLRERKFPRGFQRLGMGDSGGRVISSKGDGQWLANVRDHMSGQRGAVDNGVAREGVLKTLAQCGIIGLPDDRIGSDGAEIDIAGVEPDFKLARALRRDG